MIDIALKIFLNVFKLLKQKQIVLNYFFDKVLYPNNLLITF